MTDLSGSDLQTILNITTPLATCETIMNHAIRLLNTYGADVAEMTGTAGSKTWSGTPAEAGAILEVACMVYASKTATSGGTSESVTIGPLGHSTSSSMSSSSTTGGGGSAENAARVLARQLIEVEAELG